jgi:hypothetical protein
MSIIVRKTSQVLFGYRRARPRAGAWQGPPSVNVMNTCLVHVEYMFTLVASTRAGVRFSSHLTAKTRRKFDTDDSYA